MAATVGPKKVHRYSLEFKIQAVRLASLRDIQVQDVARALAGYLLLSAVRVKPRLPA